MSTLISSVEHALAVAASDTVKVAKFVETSVLPESSIGVNGHSQIAMTSTSKLTGAR